MVEIQPLNCQSLNFAPLPTSTKLAGLLWSPAEEPGAAGFGREALLLRGTALSAESAKLRPRLEAQRRPGRKGFGHVSKSEASQKVVSCWFPLVPPSQSRVTAGKQEAWKNQS